MKHVNEAYTVLLKAEEDIQEVMRRALSEQCYGDVAQIAALAEDFKSLLQSEHVEGNQQNRPKSNQRNASSSRGRTHRKPVMHRTSHAKERYPKFERDGEKLIKIGWSKKEKKIYEHRAPKEAVICFHKQMTNKKDPNTTFTMDEILPVPDTNGGEVPSYQAYLALAWLRDCGVVRRKGRDGYIYSERSIDEESIKELWTALPERE